MVKDKNSNEEVESGLKGHSGRVIVAAISINFTIFLMKICVWLYTGSHSMFAESIHSVADTANQIILAFGLHKSAKNPNVMHPYGYANMKYISSLISGVAIFCVGTGFSFYNGIAGLTSGEHHEDLSYTWAYIVLIGSFCFESVTLLMAIMSIRNSSKKANQSFISYVTSGADPCVNVVLFEDTAAVAGAAVAAVCIGLTAYLESPIPDSIGSILVGIMLACVAALIIYTSVPALVGRSIKLDELDKINQELRNDTMIKAIYDVKGIDMGNSTIRYKAEIDFNGRELTRKYLKEHEITKLWEEVKAFHNIDHLHEFMLKHGENIVDITGDEIDRIEVNLSGKFPEVRHIDLELERKVQNAIFFNKQIHMYV